MADSTRIEEIISQAALKAFDELKVKVNENVDNVARLVEIAVKLNGAFAMIKTPREFNAGVKEMIRSEKELITTAENLAIAQKKLNDASALNAQKEAINALTIELKKLQLEKIKQAKADKEAEAEAKKQALADKEAEAAAKKRTAEELAASIEKLKLIEKEREAEEKLERAKKLAADIEENRISAEESKARRLAEIPERLRKQAEKDAAEEAARAAKKKADEERAANVPPVSEEARAIDKLSESYGGLVEASVKNKLESKQLAEQRRLLTKEFKEGRITQAQYQLGLGEIEVAQLRVSRSGQEINKALKNASAGANAAKGSLDQLRAKLNTATQALDNMGAAEKKSDIGKALIKDVKLLTAEITAQEQATGRFQRNVGNYASALKGFNDLVGGLVLATVGYVGLDTLGTFLKDSITEFNQAEQSVSRLKNILENVGRVDVFNRLTTNANEFADAYKQLDNDDITQVFTKLVTYGKLTENQIKKVTPVIIDFAAKTGLSLEDAAQKIILGLEGQGRAFKEFGITIKDASNPAEAFGLIMTELKPKVEGAAKAFGETTAGQIAITKQEINNLKEDIGGKLQPALKGFYSFLSVALAGVPKLFTTIDDSIQRAFDSAKLIGKIGLQVVTGNLVGAASTIAVGKAQIEINTQAIAKEKELSNIRKIASDISKDASTKPLEEQQKMLNDQVLLEDASRKNYISLVSSGKRFTEEGKKAGIELLKNKTITQELAKVMKQAADVSIIGGGDPDKDFKAAKDSGEKLKAIDEKFFADELKDQAEALKAISNNEAFYFKGRIEKRKEAYAIEKKLIEEQKANEIKNAKANLESVTGDPKSSKNARINAENEYSETIKEIKKKSAYDLKKIDTSLEYDLLRIKNSAHNKRLEDDRAQHAEDIKQFEGQAKDKLQKQYDLQAESNAQEIARISGNATKDVEALNAKFEKEFIAAKDNKEKLALLEEEYGRRRAEIDLKYSQQIVEQQIKYAEILLKIERTKGEESNKTEIAKKEAEIAELKKQLADLKKKTGETDAKNSEDDAKAKYAALVSTLSKIKEISDQVTSTISGLLEARATAEKNKIQDQIDLIEKRGEAEINAINASADSEEKKAARIQAVQATTAAQKQVLEQRQRQIDQRKAEYDKALAIAQIIITTALAVAKALPNIPLAIAVGALGAAQLAVAITTPIPRFEHGTLDAPGGLAYVNEKRKELVITPSGELIETPGTPVVMDIPRHSMVFPDITDITSILASSITKRPLVDLKSRGGSNRDIIEALGSKLDRLDKTIKNKTENHFHKRGDGWERIKKSGGNQTRYLN